MGVIDHSAFFALTGITPNNFRVAINRKEVALAFGLGHPLAGGRFVDLDVVSMRLGAELAPAFGRQLAATIVKAFSDAWTEAVSRADRTSDAIFFVVIETGHPLEGGMRRVAAFEGINAGCATARELAEAIGSAKRPPPRRITIVNVSDLLANIRLKALELGVDLSAPFLPLTDDPAFAEAKAEAKKSREALVARIEARP